MTREEAEKLITLHECKTMLSLDIAEKYDITFDEALILRHNGIAKMKQHSKKTKLKNINRIKIIEELISCEECNNSSPIEIAKKYNIPLSSASKIWEVKIEKIDPCRFLPKVTDLQLD